MNAVYDTRAALQKAQQRLRDLQKPASSGTFFAQPSNAADYALRPKTLEDFIGQGATRERLDIALTAAQKRGDQLDHVLLSGPPGLGKTTLANIVASTMSGPLVFSSGPALSKTADLVQLFMTLERNAVVFIDEIHRLNMKSEEFMYPALEDFHLDFVEGRTTTRIALPPFTLIAATTRPGTVSEPLRDRIRLKFVLQLYSPADMLQIVRRSATLLDMKLEAKALEQIARRSRGTPRIANALLRCVRDYASVRSPQRATIPVATAVAALELEGIDANGLDHLDRRYLRAVVKTFKGGPVGIANLAATLDVSRDTLEDTVEPFLLQGGYITIGPGGRRALDAARVPGVF